MLFVLAASFVTLCTGFLFVLAVIDVIWAKQEGLNGPIQFMNQNNARHQLGLLILSLFFLGYALEFYHIDSTRAFTFLCICGSVDALCSIHYRKRMAQLVDQYMGIKGGRRKTDPA